LRILLLHQFFLDASEGGGSRFNEMTKVWTEKGHEVVVLSGMMHYTAGAKADKYRGKYFVKEQLSEQLMIIRCHVSESYNANFLGRLWGYFSFMFSALFAGLFKTKGKFDIILVTSPPLFVGITAMFLSVFKRVPYLFEIRDLWPESAIDTGVLTNGLIIKLSFWLEKIIYKRALLINVLTPAFRQTLIEKKNINPEKIIFIPNASDFSLSDNLLQNFDKEKFKIEKGWADKFIVIYVGAHGVANHLIQLVETAELLKGNENILLLSIGAGMQKNMLVDEVEKRKLTNIVFHPPVSKSEVFEYIFASDVGASILKKVDTFKTIYSNKTFDYMACKKPILMAIDGVSRELIEKANAGIFVEPENPKDFADKILYYYNHRNDVIQHGENGYQYAKQNFDRTNLAIKYLMEMERVVKK
jgi:glycosyltransferase involved in cell wall biosynthesis